MGAQAASAGRASVSAIAANESTSSASARGSPDTNGVTASARCEAVALR
jgi:hypothetical protein